MGVKCHYYTPASSLLEDWNWFQVSSDFYLNTDCCSLRSHLQLRFSIVLRVLCQVLLLIFSVHQQWCNLLRSREQRGYFLVLFQGWSNDGDFLSTSLKLLGEPVPKDFDSDVIFVGFSTNCMLRCCADVGMQ